ncbi:MAG TPA: mannose-1-phosphate guanylyltransferase [Candidatus Saccharimonadales bacterium]|nr:mannose-1-phosphate guanylyltransferase [Candidatus Saccharimonadales bacterium]
MIVVIIAGGSGTRLWPLSTPDYPKHLLNVNNDKNSLLQMAYERARKLTDKVYIVSEASHIEHVKQQLSDLPDEKFIVEPGRRGTANCIVAALVYISGRHKDDEAIAFIHSDHYIRDLEGFAGSFRLAEKISNEQQRIVLIGVEPLGPATIFGYIEKGQPLKGQDLVANVNSFKEKPDRETAEKYVKSGKYLWNGGYFVGSLSVFLKSMSRAAPELYDAYQRLKKTKADKFKKTYLSLKNEAIDYALMEKLSNLLVVPASFDWMDLGSFGDLARAAGGDAKGNHAHGDNIAIEEVTNSYIHNGDIKPVIVIGLDNVIVVNTPAGLLVTRKDMAQKVGELSKRFTNNVN